MVKHKLSIYRDTKPKKWRERERERMSVCMCECEENLVDMMFLLISTLEKRD
jgi:hypothetical protein